MVAVPPSAAGCKPTVLLEDRPLLNIIATGFTGCTMKESYEAFCQDNNFEAKRV